MPIQLSKLVTVLEVKLHLMCLLDSDDDDGDDDDVDARCMQAVAKVCK